MLAHLKIQIFICKKHMCQIQVPEEYEQPFVHINNTARRTFSGMVMAMDEAVRVLQNKYTITHQPDINIFNLSCKWWFAVLTSLHNLCNNQLQPFQDDKGVYGNGHGPGCITGIWCRASWAADPLPWKGLMNVGYPPKQRIPDTQGISRWINLREISRVTGLIFNHCISFSYTY